MSTRNPDDAVVLAAIGILGAASVAYAGVYGSVGLVLGLAVLLGLAALAVAGISRGGTGSQIGLPALGMGMVALLIHAARGQAEAHFAVFAFLAVTIVYRHWLPVLAAAGTIAVHHLSFNYFQQWGWGPICFTEPGLGRVIEHAAYVVVEAGILMLMAQRTRRDFLAGEELSALASRLVSADGVVDFSAVQAPCEAPAAKQMQEALRRIEASIADVRASALSIQTASNEIATGNFDLSSRTEQAAGNLQKTASAMEEITVTVRHSTDSALQANQLAETASTVARRGGAVVSQVVSTMDEINTSSRKISDIIGVIDGIAFQTNILALNAAVEAARAGEQGRGFAVVASEVRSLAQRSAEAAREIKGLIGTSVEKVATGSKLVADAGATMGEIVDSVQRVTAIIAEISSSAGEQNNGLGLVNQAVAELDRMTQQNAALVEESTAATQSLRDQADRLSQSVSAFRLAGSPAQANHAPAPAASRTYQPAAAMATRAAAPTPRAMPARKSTGATGVAPTRTPAGMPARAGTPAPTPAPLQTPNRSPKPALAETTAPDDDWQSF